MAVDIKPGETIFTLIFLFATSKAIDLENPMQREIQDGELLATADQHGDQLAVFGIEYALQIFDTGAIPADRKTPVDLITSGQL